MTQLEADWSEFYQIELSGEVMRAATSIARQGNLRAADAIHLAAAEELRKVTIGTSDQFALVASDSELKRAAQVVGMTVFDPEQPV